MTSPDDIMQVALPLRRDGGGAEPMDADGSERDSVPDSQPVEDGAAALGQEAADADDAAFDYRCRRQLRAAPGVPMAPRM